MSSPYGTASFRQAFAFTFTTPLGMRLWDSVTDSVIADGMRVTAYLPAKPAQRVEAFTNRQSVYILRNLPGLQAIERGNGDQAFWAAQSATKRFFIEVVDITKEQRFQPFFFPADLPQKGLFKWNSGTPFAPSDTATEASIPLFSAPTRSLPGAMAVIRAELWDTATSSPAAWAMLEGQIPGQPAVRGFADRQGRIVLIFPYPQPANMQFGVPEVPLTQQEWKLPLRAAYTPRRPAYVIPNLYDTLTQLSATLWADAASTHPYTEIVLKFGQEAIFPSVVWITAKG